MEAVACPAVAPAGAPSLTTMWHLARPWIDRACSRSSGRYTTETVYRDLMLRNKQLWCAVDGDNVHAVMVTEILTYATGLKTCFILMCVGRGRTDWQHLMDNIIDWAKSCGCQMMESWARPGWERVLGDWRKTHVMLEYDIGR